MKITSFTPHDSQSVTGVKKREEAERSLAGRVDSRLNLEIPAGVCWSHLEHLTAQLAGAQFC